MLENKEHLTSQGIETLKSMASQMNTNRTFEEKWEFCLEHTSKSTITPGWIQGFTDGEGCFYFYMGKQKLNGKVSSTWLLQASLEIAQNTHDVAVLELIQSFFGCGIMKPKRNNNELKTAQSVRSVSRYVVSNLSDVMNVIIPFFDAHPLFTSKSLDYEDWKTIIQMKVSKEHFTEAGVQKMFKIKSQMNRGRKDFSRPGALRRRTYAAATPVQPVGSGRVSNPLGQGPTPSRSNILFKDSFYFKFSA
jgi:hypothetical protein